MSITGQTLVRFCGALALGLAATAIDHRIDLGRATALRPEVAQVVVAAMDVPEGAIIDRRALVVVWWPTGTIPAGAFQSVDSVVGRVARDQLFKGEAIVPGRLAPEGTGPWMQKITPGKRAYSIRVNDVNGIAGMIMPNSRVDVLVMAPDPRGGGKQVASVFMTNVRVLAIGPLVQRGADGRASNSRVATLELTPEEVEKIAIAANQGSISLALRGYGDPDSASTAWSGATRDLLLRRYAPWRSVPDSVRVTVWRAPR